MAMSHETGQSMSMLKGQSVPKVTRSAPTVSRMKRRDCSLCIRQS